MYLLAAAAVLLLTVGIARAAVPATSPATKPASVYDFTVQGNDGRAVELSQYRGKVLLIVNTASKCGHTPQYAGLQKLHEKYHEQGLAVLAFPSNDFSAQEPGTNQQIRQFCTANYGVSFDLFAKVAVRGKDQVPLYTFMTGADGPTGGAIKWNFTKFLVGRDGRVLARFEPKIKADSPEVVQAIESELANKPKG
jgi:glutathione peroxidase